ncbi:GntR family transcriptional regulator [bacterium]|nr:GntR family transcriptional regulator [bacterium]
MKPILAAPSLTDQVYDAIVDDICDGSLPAGAHLVQERLASKLGVSRQPVQQAMALLKANGMVEEIGGRGLRVAPLDLTQMRQRYEIRGGARRPRRAACGRPGESRRGRRFGNRARGPGHPRRGRARDRRWRGARADRAGRGVSRTAL